MFVWQQNTLEGSATDEQVFAAALKLDGPTLVNLELLESSLGGPVGSLLACLDSCVTSGETVQKVFCLR